MKIDKFTKKEFGTLTTITSEKTGVIMFIGKEIADIWGHTNITQSVQRLCNKDEYKKLSLKKFPDFKKQLLNNNLLSSLNASSIILLTESAVYKLALSSNLEKAKPFKDWVTQEVLPSIRKNGYYSIADQTQGVLLHTNVSIQKQNSKEINSKNLIENGLESVIEYNKTSCLLHTGKTPHEIKEIGKNLGLKSIQRTSAKEVLRNIKPELACSMSFVDSLTSKGFDLKTVTELSLKCAVPLFEGMIELGIKPKELE